MFQVEKTIFGENTLSRNLKLIQTFKDELSLKDCVQAEQKMIIHSTRLGYLPLE